MFVERNDFKDSCGKKRAANIPNAVSAYQIVNKISSHMKADHCTPASTYQKKNENSKQIQIT